jgi:hypothetical protein
MPYMSLVYDKKFSNSVYFVLLILALNNINIHFYISNDHSEGFSEAATDQE